VGLSSRSLLSRGFIPKLKERKEGMEVGEAKKRERNKIKEEKWK
jgi:hypothetical protein